MGIWREIFRRLIGAEVNASVALLKIQSAIVYLNIIKNTRRLTKLVCLLVLFIIVLACGFLLIPISLCLFMPWTGETKAIVAASVGAAYILIPLIVMLSLFSERRWLRVSRADKLVRAALRK